MSEEDCSKKAKELAEEYKKTKARETAFAASYNYLIADSPKAAQRILDKAADDAKGRDLKIKIKRIIRLFSVFRNENWLLFGMVRHAFYADAFQKNFGGKNLAECKPELVSYLQTSIAIEGIRLEALKDYILFYPNALFDAVKLSKK